MGFSQKTIKMVWGRAAGRCSFAQCRCELTLDPTVTSSAVPIGDICHIVAESEAGPRGESPLTAAERDQYGNLILLCPTHHAVIDTQWGSWPEEELHKVKKEHEEWVRAQLAGYDAAKQRDEERYADYVDHFAEACSLDNWTGWTGNVLNPGGKRIRKDQYESLSNLRRWIFTRIWPGRYPSLEKAFGNFRVVLQDFLLTLDEHLKDDGRSDEGWLRVEKFYKIAEWNPERYEFLAKKYDKHVELLDALTIELTRAANWVCDEVRRCLLPEFRIAEGHLTVYFDHGLTWSEEIPRYSPEEEAAELSYPGLEEFKRGLSAKVDAGSKAAPQSSESSAAPSCAPTSPAKGS